MRGDMSEDMRARNRAARARNGTARKCSTWKCRKVRGSILKRSKHLKILGFLRRGVILGVKSVENGVKSEWRGERRSHRTRLKDAKVWHVGRPACWLRHAGVPSEGGRGVGGGRASGGVTLNVFNMEA